jgi:hemolysin D
MSVTTTQPTRPGTPPPNGKPGSLFSGRARAVRDDTPTEMLEFYSPSTALQGVMPKLAARNAVLVIGTMVLCLILVAATFKMDRTVSANGKIVSLTPELVVQPLSTAIVKTIAVSAGDIVHKGQLLAQLDPTFAAADNTAALDQVDRYKTEIDRLNAENRQQPYRPSALSAGALVQEGIFAQRASAREAELRYYRGQIDAQRALMAQADADVRQYAKETGVAADVEKMRQQLEHDLVGSRIDTLNAVSQRLEAERQVLASVQQEENTRSMVASLTGQLDNYNQQWFADISQTITQDSLQLATYRDQLEHAALNFKLIDLRAEQDATVLSVAPVSVGSVIQPGMTFFTLVPLNAPLEVDAQVTGDESGFVFTGQPVQIKFNSFPSNEFGMGNGSVRLISADSFLTSTTAATSGPSAAGTAANSVFTGVSPNSAFYYDTRVTLDRLALKNVPKDLHIVPGMAVTADIKVGERTVLEYMVERMAPMVTEGMREPN